MLYLGCGHIHLDSSQPYALQAGVIANATNSAKLAAAAAEKRLASQAHNKGRRLSAAEAATGHAAAAAAEAAAEAYARAADAAYAPLPPVVQEQREQREQREDPLREDPQLLLPPPPQDL